MCIENRRAAGIPTDRVPDPVPLDVNGHTIYVRAMTPGEVADYFRWFMDTPIVPPSLHAGALFALSVCDERGDRLYGIEEAADVIERFDARGVRRRQREDARDQWSLTMPKRPPTLAVKPGAVRAPDHRPSPSRRGYERGWQRIRAWHLAHYPLCEDCKECDVITEATEVDHVERLRDSGDHSAENLRSLCKSCHSKKTVKCDGGLGRGKV